MVPISAAFCNNAVEDVKLEPIAMAQAFDPQTELR